MRASAKSSCACSVRRNWARSSEATRLQPGILALHVGFGRRLARRQLELAGDEIHGGALAFDLGRGLRLRGQHGVEQVGLHAAPAGCWRGCRRPGGPGAGAAAHRRRPARPGAASRWTSSGFIHASVRKCQRRPIVPEVRRSNWRTVVRCSSRCATSRSASMKSVLPARCGTCARTAMPLACTVGVHLQALRTRIGLAIVQDHRRRPVQASAGCQHAIVHRQVGIDAAAAAAGGEGSGNRCRRRRSTGPARVPTTAGAHRRNARASKPGACAWVLGAMVMRVVQARVAGQHRVAVGKPRRTRVQGGRQDSERPLAQLLVQGEAGASRPSIHRRATCPAAANARYRWDAVEVQCPRRRLARGGGGRERRRLRSSTSATSSARMVPKLRRRASNGSSLMRPLAAVLVVTQRLRRTWPPTRTPLAWMWPGYRL